ncbi:SPFH domain-containing protein [Beggiatoa leptomitoformis]|uniref:SPFH domain-containing protein n=1 Tax=Beggiatoa leptomitoformis TaxID=288004 RepID=A0A2N9YCY8_9GAMM|nr:SPFH domain-containing protein [Beggiatoa leptomitoformis]ALG69246.1 SPFH domain-containing protein [Beggiatoa leptomitoformis]AUI68317.1 SPFH domain-containing protein [Beggiatoa leptomitoformis]
MFGFRFIKTQPTTYLIQYVKGQIKREGRGLAFFYFEPTTSLVAVPLESVDVPFIFYQTTADYQEITIQGQVTYRAIDPKKLAQLVNFTLDSKGRGYVGNDPEKLPQRLINTIQVFMQSALRDSRLRETLVVADVLVEKVKLSLEQSKEVQALGLEILNLSILSIKPNPDTARALEADVRENLLREADQAVYARRNAAVEQERAIRENELNTEIAIENKKRQIREAQIEADRAIQEKQQALQEAEMRGKVVLETEKKQLVVLQVDNLQREADSRAYSLTVTMQALAGVDAKVLQALASIDMNPSQLVALAFRDLADSADKIGQLNISPELLSSLLQTAGKGKK